MTYLSGMGKNKEATRIEVHLMPDELRQFEALANERQWSKKKMAENIIKWYLKEQENKNGNGTNPKNI